MTFVLVLARENRRENLQTLKNVLEFRRMIFHSKSTNDFYNVFTLQRLWNKNERRSEEKWNVLKKTPQGDCVIIKAIFMFIVLLPSCDPFFLLLQPSYFSHSSVIRMQWNEQVLLHCFCDFCWLWTELLLLFAQLERSFLKEKYI